MIERAEFQQLQTKVDTMGANVIRLQEQVSSMQEKIEELVTRHEFTPVKMICYGLAASVMSSVMVALLARVIIK